MKIKLKNTLTGNKELFIPITPGVVSMYNCGPTVYNFPSIGNMRSYVFADTLRRVFEYSGLQVNQVINITDVGHLVGDGDTGEDKIEKTAKKEGKTAEEIAHFYEEAFYRDLKDLNIETNGVKFPRASQHIKEQIEIIKILEKKYFTYKTGDGIYFDTSKFPDYGKLGNINISGLKEGARVELNLEKKNLTDFALWKFSSPPDGAEKRLQEWPSPWGTGFPGWHIECSAMSRKYLGQPFDIHTGGIDHIPVHHNNEIAQSEAAFGTPLAHYWLHNEFLTVDDEKMSKSIGNIFTLADLKNPSVRVGKKIHPISLRFLFLMSRYASRLNFTQDAAEGAQNTLEKIVLRYSDLPDHPSNMPRAPLANQKNLDLQQKNMARGALGTFGVEGEVLEKFEEALSLDLNTPVAISLLQIANSKKEVDQMDRMLGLNIKKLSEQIHEIPNEIKDLQKGREEARKNEDWKLSDNLRDQIESRGFYVKDSDQKTIILRAISSLI